MSETISKASVCEILADIYPTDGEKVVAVKEVDKAYEAIQQLPPADVQLDTKELVAKIKKGISATNADDVYSCGMRDGMRWCMSLVDGKEPLFDNCTSAQPEQRWIPCSERIPEEYGEYLISWTTSQSKRQFIEICECEVTSEYDYEHERFECEWLLDDYITNYPDVTVIAWMPLPEPYKEGTDD